MLILPEVRNKAIEPQYKKISIENYNKDEDSHLYCRIYKIHKRIE
jgi:hypothetical protein